MTKMKSKKMTKSTFAIIIMGIVMVAMLAFGGTFAYFTATAKDIEAKTVTGTILLSNSSTSAIDLKKQNVLPKESLLSDDDVAAMKFSTKSSNRAQIVFVTFTASAVGSNSQEITLGQDFKLDITVPTGSDWVQLETDTGVYAKLVAADTEEVAFTGLQINFDANASADNGTVPAAMGATVTLTITGKSIQAVGSDGQEITALTAANAQTMYNLIG